MEMSTTSKKKGLKRILTSLAAMMLCLVTPLTAFAGAGGTQASPQTAELTKTLKYADGVGLSTPSATFTFDFTAKSLDGSATMLSSMPSISQKQITYSGSDAGTVSNGVVSVTKDTGNILSGLTFTAGGVYVYEVEEQATGFTAGTGETMNYSSSVFDLYVVVAFDQGTNSYYVEQTYTDLLVSGSSSGGKGGAAINDGDYNFIFTNTYTKLGGATPGTDALTITKAVAGTGADTNKQFSYTIELDDSAAVPANGSYSGTLTRADGTTTSVSVDGDGTSVNFTLADGEKLVFDDLPAGTEFTVEETGVPAYTASYTGTDNSGAITDAAAAGANLSTGVKTIGCVNNEVNFTNTYDQSSILPPGGILMNNLPFIILIGAALVALVAFAAINRRKATRS